MRVVIVTGIATVLTLLGSVGTAFAAANPGPTGTGLPSQSCQSVEAAGGTVPGSSSSSPGSPFNESGINSANGGTGGQNYRPTSQYDVACFQVSQH